MRFTKKEVERIRQDLSGLTETLDDTCRAHKILGECMAMCRRWNSLLDLEAENAELKKVISGADSLLDGIFERIPYTFMTGYGWDEEWEEIKNCGATNSEAGK